MDKNLILRVTIIAPNQMAVRHELESIVAQIGQGKRKSEDGLSAFTIEEATAEDLKGFEYGR